MARHNFCFKKGSLIWINNIKKSDARWGPVTSNLRRRPNSLIALFHGKTQLSHSRWIKTLPVDFNHTTWPGHLLSPYITPSSSSLLIHHLSLSLSLSLIIKRSSHFLRATKPKKLYSELIMAVDLMRFPKMDDQKAIQEAASQGLQSMEHLIRVLSTNRPEQQSNVDCSEITDFTVSKFKTVISLLNRTGHARFRRGPVHSTSSSPPIQQSQIVKTAQPEAPVVSQPARATTSLPPSRPSVTLDFTKPSIFGSNSKSSELEFSKENFSVSLSSSFMTSALTGDGSVSKGSSIFAPSQTVTSSGKPPLAGGQPYRKRCIEHEHSQNFSGKISGSGHGKCHCKKRYCYVIHLSLPLFNFRIFNAKLTITRVIYLINKFN